MLVSIIKQPFVDEYHTVPACLVEMVKNPLSFDESLIPDGEMYTLSGLVIGYDVFYDYCKETWSSSEDRAILFWELADYSIYNTRDHEYTLGDALKYCDDHDHQVSCQYTAR